MADQRKTIHVVSNSHWDREWGYPFEETRLLLLDFMDNLLELLGQRSRLPLVHHGFADLVRGRLPGATSGKAGDGRETR